MFILWTAIIFAILAVVIGIIITFAQKIFAVKEDPIVEKIDKILPQTQCGQCGYPGCLPYAQALANGDEINKCVPGGQELVVKLAELLDREVPAGQMEEPEDLIAVIREKDCIGCLHCIEACPVDAIIGAKKLLHVIVPDYCTGCKLCVDPCPVKCIDMIPRPKEVTKYSKIREESNFPKGVTANTLIKVTNVVPTSTSPYLNLNNLNSEEAQQVAQSNEQQTYNSKLVARLAAKIAQAKENSSQDNSL
ncbi:electron transport complex subunit RsxB [Psittacicella gerlachiana]|uniref:Ion-translocating oxidoreductase complex subunit B n=1 Tax=Psittacicella gerlachiana TaxID=2028574 RepID=A0A3A1YJD1_9GAMM|nr:electron transport complex subunit RsxB [Psittacicella gerlachiana]RIY37160.1 electron transport complex subunit RsxB [Psittacicella gerlachiana]